MNRHHSCFTSVFVTLLILVAYSSWGMLPPHNRTLSYQQQSEAAQTIVPLSTHAAPLLAELEKRTGQLWAGYSRADGFSAWRLFGAGLQTTLPNSETEAYEIGRKILNPLLPLVYGKGVTISPWSAHHTCGGWYIFFRQSIDQIPVEGSMISLHIDQAGRVTSLRLGIVDPQQVRAFDGNGSRFAQTVVEDLTSGNATLVEPVWLVQDGNFSTGPLVKASYKVECDVAPDDKPILFVDAKNGTILAGRNRVFFDTARVAVQGTMKPEYQTDSNQTRPFRDLSVTIAGSSVYTDSLGNGFLVRAGSGNFSTTANLTGRFVNVTQNNGPRTVQSANGAGPLLLDFTVPPAVMTEPNLYYHVNLMHSWYKSLDPFFTGLDYAMPTSVNIQGLENAFWDGNGMAFGAGGSSFYDFGMFTDVIYHEYTHGATTMIYGGADPNSTIHEGWADFFACAINGDPLEGDGLSRGGNPYFRNLDNNLRTPEDLTGEGHYDGQILSGAMWHTRMVIGERYGDSLFHNARHSMAYTFQDYLMDILELDDNDGNVTNGTPHLAGIAPAFARHGINLPFVPRTGFVTGVVTRYRDHLPVAGATVRVEGSNDSTLTNALGEYQLQSYGSMCRLQVTAAGYIPILLPFTIIADSTLVQNFEFRTVGYITGLVSAALTSQPIPNVLIQVLNESIIARTDSTGHYLLPSMQPQCQLHIDIPGFNPASAPVTVIPDSIVVQDFALLQPVVVWSSDSIDVSLSLDGQDTIVYTRIDNQGDGYLDYWLDIRNYDNTMTTGITSSNSQRGPVRDNANETDEVNEPWSEVFSFDASSSTQDFQIQGVEFDGRNFWVTGANTWSNPNRLYKFDRSGSLLASYPQPDTLSSYGWRDLAWDGTYLYGSTSRNIDQFDTLGHVVRSLVTNTNPARALACDTANGLLYYCDRSSPIYSIRLSDGATVATLPNQGNIYGFAWYEDDVDGMKLYSFQRDATNSGCQIVKIDPATGSTRVVADPIGITTEKAAGAAITCRWDPLLWVFAGVFTTDAGVDRIGLYEILFNTSWVNLLPDSGRIAAGELDSVAVRISSRNMPVGNYRVLLQMTTNAIPATREIPLIMRVVSTGVTEPLTDVTGIPKAYALRQNYPNPFNATTTISYDIPKAGMVEVKLFDVTGREVSTLVNFQQNPGTYRVTFDGKSLSTGTYFVRLQSGNFSQTKKMVLLK